MKKIFLILFCIINLITVSFATQVEYEQYHFANREQANLFYKIIRDTRCVVCQGQNIADSNAPLANDLRNKIYELINANNNEEEINLFLVKRYGDYILLQPPMQGNTLILWFFPLLIVAFGMWLLVKFLISR